jgi:hypothetical protein
MHSDLGHLIASEKLIGELVGVVVAVAAIAVLARLQKGDEVSRDPAASPLYRFRGWNPILELVKAGSF